MRVPDSLLYGSTGRLISRNQQALARGAEQVSSGKAVAKAADDPAAARRIDQLKSGKRRIEGFNDNIGQARALLQQADSALDATSDLLIKARSLAMSGANGDKAPEDLANIAAEVDALRDAVRLEANTRWEGRYVFGGLADDTPPFDENDVYQGSNTPMELEVAPDIRQTVRLDGEGVFKNVAQAADVLGALEALAEALRTGDTTNVPPLLEQLDAASAHISVVRGELGAGMQRLDQTETGLEKLGLATEAARARVEDTDIASKVIELSLQERALQSAMTVAPRVLNQSLVNFLN